MFLIPSNDNVNDKHLHDTFLLEMLYIFRILYIFKQYVLFPINISGKIKLDIAVQRNLNSTGKPCIHIGLLF